MLHPTGTRVRSIDSVDSRLAIINYAPPAEARNLREWKPALLAHPRRFV